MSRPTDFPRDGHDGVDVRLPCTSDPMDLRLLAPGSPRKRATPASFSLPDRRLSWCSPSRRSTWGPANPWGRARPAGLGRARRDPDGLHTGGCPGGTAGLLLGGLRTVIEGPYHRPFRPAAWRPSPTAAAPTGTPRRARFTVRAAAEPTQKGRRTAPPKCLSGPWTTAMARFRRRRTLTWPLGDPGPGHPCRPGAPAWMWCTCALTPKAGTIDVHGRIGGHQQRINPAFAR